MLIIVQNHCVIKKKKNLKPFEAFPDNNQQLLGIMYNVVTSMVFRLLFTVQKVNKLYEALNTDWLTFWQSVHVAEMLSLELKPVLRVSSSRHALF